jgi:hypothetical protein
MAQGFTRGTPIDTDPNLALDSDLVVPSQKAIKDYVDTGLNTKQDTLTLTTTGTSGAATLIGATLNIPQYSGGSNAGSISITISGFGGVISIGQVGGFMTIPFNGTITGWIISSVDSTGAALSGSCVIGTYKDTYANFPPTSGDEIFTDKPTLTAQSKNQNLAPAFIGAGATVTSGDMIGFYVISCSTCTLINLTLLITKS